MQLSCSLLQNAVWHQSEITHVVRYWEINVHVFIGLDYNINTFRCVQTKVIAETELSIPFPVDFDTSEHR